MLLVELVGGPGSGKTTLASYLNYRLKALKIRSELVIEGAREHHIYDSTPGVVAPPLLDNQFLVSAQQYERVLRLKRHNMEVAISDSPIITSLLYCSQNYYQPLHDLLRIIEKELEPVYIKVPRRPGPFDPESRLQKTEAEAKALDARTYDLVGNGWPTHDWDNMDATADLVIKLVNFNRRLKFA